MKKFEPQTSHLSKPNKQKGLQQKAEKKRHKNGTNSLSGSRNSSGEPVKKKMLEVSSLNKPTPSYLSAVVKFNSRSYIEYYVWNPHSKSNSLARKTKKIDKILKRYSTKAQKQRAANEIAEQINFKLKMGWNPYFQEDLPHGFKSIKEAFEDFIKINTKGKREQTVESYKVFIRDFSRYLEKTKQLDAYIFSISKYQAISYIDFKYIDQSVSPRTRKNYVDFFTTMFNWFKERGYISSNPFKSVERKKVIKHQKYRTEIKEDLRPKILSYFKEQKPGFELVLNYLFLCLIRRTEMSKLQLKHVDMQNHLIHVPKEIAKNGRDRFVTIPNQLHHLMQTKNFDKLPSSNYLISNNDFYPGPKAINPRRITSAWNQMRKKLNIAGTNQFYSLRDSGVIDYLKAGTNNKSLVDHANWQSYDMINVYAHHKSKQADPIIAINGKLFG